MVDLQLTKGTAKNHRAKVKRFLEWLGNREISQAVIREYLSSFNGKSPSTYANELKSLKVFCRDFLNEPGLVASFKFPEIPFVPKTIIDRENLQRFYSALDNPKDKALFLLFASSGLRRKEALSLQIQDISFEDRMVKPKAHEGKTKHTWVSFFNSEAYEALKEYVASRKDNNPKLFPMAKDYERKLWHKARTKTGLDITPQMLREWFCDNLDVQDRYIDAFCGRVPKSVLARHYSDYSPEKLKQIYDKANLKVISMETS